MSPFPPGRKRGAVICYWLLVIGVDPTALIAAGSRSHQLIVPFVRGIEDELHFYSILITFTSSEALFK
jgi:hypothetical protein